MIKYDYIKLNEKEVRITNISFNKEETNQELTQSTDSIANKAQINRIKIYVPSEIDGLAVKELGSKNIEQNQHKEIINLNTNIHIKSQIKVDLIAS